jgi:putative heme-binding domain-containing protein
VIHNQEADDAERIAALAVVRAVAASATSAADIAEAWLEPQNSPELQRAAVETLAAAGNDRDASTLLTYWRGYTPAMRAHVLEVILSREAMLPALLSAIEAGNVKPADIDALSRERLLKHADITIRGKAEKVFAGGADADRRAVIEQYAEATRLPGNVADGRALFGKHCSSCHHLEGEGHTVGPDLAALTNRSPTAALESILDPNRTVDERYQSYDALTDGGLAHTGMLVRETATSITLLEPQGKERTLLRNSLESLSNSGISLMPIGFERDLSPQDMADILAYMAAQWTPPKKFAGNKPEIVRPDDDGVLWLRATNGSIFGDSIVFEEPFQNVGYWHGEQDYVAWDVEVDAATTYVAHLHWACAADSAGNAAVLEGGDAPLRVTVANTDGYDNYQLKAIGELVLSAGQHRLVMRPDGPLKRAHLLDLRGIYLLPQGSSADRVLAEQPSVAESRGAADEIAKQLEGLAVGTSKEYERIPIIWQAAIAAGRRNDAVELMDVIELSLPAVDGPLQHWQAVVLGGGVINGLSAAGHWPADRLGELLTSHAELQIRWARALELAAAMVDDASVPAGTRYDALRILGAAPFDQHGKLLVKYMATDADAELQMGAVSGLSDMDSDDATVAIMAAFDGLTDANRSLALSALLRTKARAAGLLDALELGQIDVDKLTPDHRKQLLQRVPPQLRAKTERIIRQ